MIDPRCHRCREHADALGDCRGHEMDDVASHSALACFTPTPAAGPKIDELTGEPLVETGGELPADEIHTGPEFPVGLVGRLLCSGPAHIRMTDEQAIPPPAAAVWAEPETEAAPPHRPVPAGPCEPQKHRCRLGPPGAAGVSSGPTRGPDYRGSPAARPIRGRPVVPMILMITMAAAVAAAAATDGAATSGPDGGQGTHAARPGVSSRQSAIRNPQSAIERLLAAIRQVESGGNDRAIGDGGKAIGPYQLHREYWIDGGGEPGRYRLDAWDAAACRPVILGYWKRYCPAALAAGDARTLARVHNGGPNGARKAATLPYWRKVQRQLTIDSGQRTADGREEGRL